MRRRAREDAGFMIQGDTRGSWVEQVFNILVMGILFIGICLEHYGGSLFGLFVL